MALTTRVRVIAAKEVGKLTLLDGMIEQLPLAEPHASCPDAEPHVQYVANMRSA